MMDEEKLLTLFAKTKEDNKETCPFPGCGNPPADDCNCGWCDTHHWLSNAYRTIQEIDKELENAAAGHPLVERTIKLLEEKIDEGNHSLSMFVLYLAANSVYEGLVTPRNALKIMIMVQSMIGDDKSPNDILRR